MSGFADQAERLLEAATLAAARGETGPAMTVLIGQTGGIEMIADSDWPLDSLLRERGAKAAYRVSRAGGRIQVEGQAPGKSCLLGSPVLLMGPQSQRRYGNAPAPLRRISDMLLAAPTPY